MLEPLEYEFFRNALLAALLVSVASGVAGTFVVTKGIATISGALAHVAFGGIGLAILLDINPFVGAACFAVTAALLTGHLYCKRLESLDTLVATVWSVGMSLGAVFFAIATGYKADPVSYLFGSILLATPGYLASAAVLDAALLAAVTVLYKQLQVVSFDEEFAAARGVPVTAVFLALLALVALVVVTLIRVVGVILTIALLTIPAAVARQWSESMGTLMLLATLITAISSVAGLFLSYYLGVLLSWHLPAGPVIILVAAAVYLISSVYLKLRDKRQ